MKYTDTEKEYSECRRTTSEFLVLYNNSLPPAFPRATLELLREFRKVYPNYFKETGAWSLGEHRKRFMDWLPRRMAELASTAAK